MVFKNDWEKADQRVQLPESLFFEMISLGFPGKDLKEYSVISGGCANLNLRFQMKNDRKPFILRIYLRDPDAAYREQNIGLLLGNRISIPTTIFVGDFGGYRFAIVEFLEGITLRDLLLGSQVVPLSEIMTEVGTCLAQIHSYQFETSGFFDADLQLKKGATPFDCAAFAKDCLKNPMVQRQLAEPLLLRIDSHLHRLSSSFPDRTERNLVHADFDPANILVNKTSGKWKVSGILDWEFAFSGSNLCDVANMLRYADQMDPIFESSFLKGAQSLGWRLPENWKISIHMLNVLSLLDCLVHTDPELRPKQLSDIRSLLLNISNRLDQHH